MMSVTRKEVLAILDNLFEHSSDIRLGQLFSQLGFLIEDRQDQSMWDIGDEQFLSVLMRFRDELIQQQNMTTSIVTSDQERE